MHGGDHIAEVLKVQEVRFIFTLCGGHISPILVGCKQRGIRVIDVRHEATAVFAADAVSRLTGMPGVAAVTAGPGATNTITAVKNAQMAQSALVLLGGATATALKGRGALQDIDQMALFKPHVKWARSAKRVRELVPLLEEAFQVAQSGVPGPVFLECPVDLLYDEALVREWYGLKTGGKSVADKLIRLYLNRHANDLFKGAEPLTLSVSAKPDVPRPAASLVRKVADKLVRAEKPLLLVGSQALIQTEQVEELAKAVQRLGIPVYLSGMARGLLGKGHALQMRHKRRQALKEADLVILAGVPCDFRLDYGRHIRRKSFLIAANRSNTEMRKNRRPNLAIRSDVAAFLIELAKASEQDHKRPEWQQTLRSRDEARVEEIRSQAGEATKLVNPMHLCSKLEQSLPQESILVADGGDFVATASYIVSPRAPLCWLDPGVFGTLGVGAGFALGAKLCRPESEVWILYGDGSVGYSLMEFDTFVRHGIAVIGVVGNDAGWTQIGREQVEVLKDDVATVLDHSNYHLAAEALGARGLLVREDRDIDSALAQARALAQEGSPVLINALLGKTDFRKGSISM
ncbi:thiamine pyrophosphate-binding protein [candidate division KSB1 bacterium]|nr:thiamine pyrophosphate-binding protein [candidate division KSB1 bacterium]